MKDSFKNNSGAVAFDGFIIPLIALMSSYGTVSALANLGTTLQSTIAAGGRVLDIIMESYMTQETQLFKDTIANNIRIGKLNATQAVNGRESGLQEPFCMMHRLFCWTSRQAILTA